MSMNLFIKVFTADQMADMARDHSLIDRWVLKEAQAIEEMDLGTAWEVLDQVLKGVGQEGDVFVDRCLFNGAELIQPQTVQAHAARIGAWTAEQVWDAVQALDEDADLYHQEIWQDEDSAEEIQDYFSTLQALLQRAAQQGHGLIVYHA